MRLCERNFGDYEGKLISEVDIHSLRRWTDNAPTPNGETIREAAKRVFDSLDEIKEKYSGRNILLVVHGHIMRAIIWYFKGTPKDEETITEIDNCAFYEFDA
jgi:broad specificity phosphatase PhoE